MAVSTNNVTDWLTSDDLHEFINPFPNHWTAMLKLLCRAWSRSRGVLMYGEMSLIYDHIDMASGLYMARKYGDNGKASRIIDAMKMPISNPTISATGGFRFRKQTP